MQKNASVVLRKVVLAVRILRFNSKANQHRKQTETKADITYKTVKIIPVTAKAHLGSTAYSEFLDEVEKVVL